MRVIPPLEITPARLTSSSVPEVAPPVYSNVATYVVDSQVSVIGDLGVVTVYKSLASGNLGNNPAASPTFWLVIGTTYTSYDSTLNYVVGHRVLDPSTHLVHESLFTDNKGYPLNNSPSWLKIGIVDYVNPSMFDFAKTYAVGDVVGQGRFYFISQPYPAPSTSIHYPEDIAIYRSKTASNIGNSPGASPANWELISVTYPLYDATKSYGISARVVDSSKNFYESLVGANLGRLLSNPTGWAEVGLANKFAMFNYTGSTRTVAASPLVVTLTPSKKVDAIDISGLANVQTVRVQMSVSGSPVYDQTISTVKRNVSSWYTHFFAPFMYKKSAVKFDLPPYSSGVITVTFTSAAGNVEVGSLMIGSQFYVGKTQYNAVRDYVNYSTVAREFDGSIAKLLQRPGIPKSNQSVWLAKKNVQALSEFLRSVDATPISISGIDDTTDGYFEPVHIVGLIKSAPIDLAHPTHAICNMEIEAISSN